MNEDLLNPNMHNLKVFLLLNSLHNIISEPTRQLALLDPITVHEDMSTLSQGIIQVPNEISDHCATYVHIPFEYPPLLHFSLSVKAVTLIFISGRDLAISSTHEGKTGNINGKTENCNCLLRVNKYKLDSVKQNDP